MRESTNYKFNLPDKIDQFNLDHWNQNTEKLDEKLKSIDEKLKSIDDKDLELNDLINNKFNDLLNGNPSDPNSLYYKLMLKAHPVGSLYWSSKPTNPAKLFGGTWTQIKDKFILACGDTYSVNATGGNANTTLAVNNLPSHTHSFTPRGTVSAHSHGLNSHTHSFSATTSDDGTHDHEVLVSGWFTYQSGGDIDMFVPDFDTLPAGDRNRLDFTKNYGRSSSPKTGAHAHTILGTTGAASGNTANATPTFIGTSDTTTSTGSNKSFSNMPPYVGKYCWERVA